MTRRRMHLVAYLKTGPTANHPGAWRHPEAALSDIFAPERYEQIARLLEEARFDACFYADTFGLPDIHGGNFDAYLRLGGQISYMDPLVVLPIMARVTKHLGLGATLSTTLLHPYWIARTLASLDMLTGGRMAWNIVTSATNLEAKNFGMGGIPGKEDLPERLDAVLDAIYAAYTKGWREIGDADAPELTDEAIWLGRLVVSLMPDQPEAKGVLALMLYSAARRAARSESTNVARAEPWDSASMPRAPLPANRSSTSAPSITPRLRRALKIASRTLSDVGRVRPPGGATSVRPRALPPTTRTGRR